MDIPGYKIEQQIAEGGMATLYLAIQTSLDRHVALKVLKKFDKPEQSVRFVNEGRFIASLNHRNIITIYDIGTVGDQLYISMEYLEGGDLEKKIAKGINPEAAIELVRTIGRCLEFIHSKGIIHRDIKPGNILFGKDGEPVLTDFGIAKQLEQDTKLTMDGTAMGSPDYLSPEQAACKPLDGRADIYSLGIVLYEMLTGRIPYKGDSYIETVMAHITSPLPDLPSHLKHYQALLDRMIAKKPGDRFSSAAEMVAFIDSLGQAPAKAKGGLFKKKPKPAPVQREFAKTIPISRQEMEAGSPMGVQTLDRGAAGRPDSKSKGASKFMLATLVILLLAAAAVWQFRPYLEGLLPLDALPQITVTTRPAPQPGVTPAPGSEPGPEVTTPARAEPEPSPPVQSEDELEVNQYLLLAKVSLEADRLTAPARDNAYYYYQKVLALDPENVAARQGLTSVANRYADLADLELSKSRYAQAGKHVEKGLYVQADNPRLLTLQKTVANHLEQARVNAEISRYLLKANAAMDADKLTTPASDNAYFYYKKVLALDPGHKEAQQGITRIANRYADLAQWQIDRYNYDKAKLYVHTGLKVQPRNKRLLALRQRTDAVKDISNRAYKGIKSLFE